MKAKLLTEPFISKNKAIIYTLFISVFLPYLITALVVIGVCLYLFIFQQGLAVFKNRKTLPIVLFSIYSAVIALVNLNFIGLCCSIGFFMMIAVLYYCRRCCTTEIFEGGLRLCCLMGTVVALFCFFEYYINTVILESKGVYRCTLYFFNCNYLATVLASVMLICAYKIIVYQKYPLLYSAAALLCGCAVYLTGSMLVWVEILFGLSMLLGLTRRNQLLSILLLFGATALIVLYCAPYLMPRLVDFSGVTTDNRISIWSVALQDIKKNPLFGRGFLGYYHIYQNYPGSYPTTHCHNFFIDVLLNFGIIGAIPLFIFILQYLKRAILCRNAQAKLQISSLILALLFALAVHAMADLTFLWIQTGLLYCLILGGLGNEERLLSLET